MFTGIIERLGTITQTTELAAGRRISVCCGWSSGDVPIGASVAINGCCLTVVGIEGDVLSFEAGRETLQRTNLGELREHHPVNLERALAADGRFDGHMVTGHVDCVGVLRQRTDNHDWSEFHIEIPAEYVPQLASKGSIAVDGVSLTIVDVNDNTFSVALIPHTLQVTALGEFAVGRHLNIETDVLAKYIQRQLQFMNIQAAP